MGSDLARLVHHQDSDALPPFRNVSPGPPDSLPTLAQLGCAISPSAPPSWTAVNHPPQSSPSRLDTDTIPDRAPAHIDNHHHHHRHNHHSSASALQNPQLQRRSPLRPNSTSHLGRRIHRPKLAPKRPISASRQDSAAPESPSPKVLESSPEAAQVILSKDTAFSPRHSPILTPPAPSLVLDSSLGPSHSARAAIYPPNHPHSTLSGPCQFAQSRYSSGQDDHRFPPLPHSHTSIDHPAKPSTRALRKPRTSLPRKLSISAPTTSTSFPKPTVPSRRMNSSVRFVEQSAMQTLADPKIGPHMPPPVEPTREIPVPVGPGSPSHTSTSSSFVSGGSSSPISEAIRAMPQSSTLQTSESKRIVPTVGSGQPQHTKIDDVHSKPSSMRINESSSPSQVDHSSPPAEPLIDRVLRCRLCSEVYEHRSLETALAQLRATQEPSESNFNRHMYELTQLLREFRENPESSYDEWIERHRHDSSLDGGSIVVHRRTPAELKESTSNSNKRKRPVNDDRPPSEAQTHYAVSQTSGDTVYVSELMARILPGAGVARQPYEPPPDDPTNMWYIPKERKHSGKRQHGGRKTLDAAHGEPDARRNERQPELKESGPSVPRLPGRTPGAAPLEQILHSAVSDGSR